MKRFWILGVGLLMTAASGCGVVAKTQEIFDRSLLGQALGRSTVIPHGRLCSYPYGPGGPGPIISESPPPELLAPPRPIHEGPLAKPVPYKP